MARPLSAQVIVIVGASSGIGRETAGLLAKEGASLVLAARDEAALREVAREVEERGGQALVVPTDVSRAEEVFQLAEQAVARFGRIDTWVNDAAVAAYATVEQMTVEEFRRIIEVDLLGTIFGAKAALPHLRASGGTLINISSVAGQRAMPLLSAYSAAKHGVIGFSDALRLELAHDRAGVQVTTILPSAMDTPFFNHARSKLGVLPRPTPPVYQPLAVAEAIAWAAAHPVREIVVGGGGKGIVVLQRLSPGLFDWLLTRRRLAFALQESDRPDDGADNLFAPMPERNEVRGEYGADTLPGNGYTRTFEFHPARQRLAIAGMLLALGALIRRAGRD
jgi:NAD(P)-dependent dehydrogenase (short-subunit alcohol dehydrogenase family)